MVGDGGLGWVYCAWGFRVSLTERREREREGDGGISRGHARAT